MTKAYLTAEEIKEIDNLSDLTLAEYLSKLPEEKKELVSHIFSKNRSLKMLKILADRSDKNNKRLMKLLDENGIKYGGDISNARGMFKGSSFGTDTLMKQKQSEKKLDNDKHF